MNNVIARELADPSGPIEPVSPTVKVLTRLVSGLMTDGDIEDVKAALTRIASHQQEKADLFAAIMNQIDQERVGDFLEIRCHQEKVLKRSAVRGDMTTQDAVNIWHIANNVIAACQANQKHVKAVDTVMTVDKVDTRSGALEQTIKQRWEGTTPQGREIIRKRLFGIKREMTGQRIIDVESTGTHSSGS
jgi:hypothetical protein